MKPLFLAVALACAALPARAIPVSLSVLGPDDQPLEGASLELRASDSAAIYGYGETTPFDAPVNAAAGTFRFDFDGEFVAADAPYDKRIAVKRVLLARISAPGMATQTRLLSTPKTIIQLTPGRSWSGVVSDRNENPIAGVRVHLNSWSLGTEPGGVAGLEQSEQSGYRAIGTAWDVAATTDAQGRWQLDDLPQSGWAGIALSKAPFARASYRLNLKDETAPPLFLKLGASVAGQVIQPDGQPLAGQLVVAGWNADPDSQTRTDAQGRFEIDGLAAGQTFLSSRDWRRSLEGKPAPDEKFLLPQQDMVQVRAGETTDIGQWKAQTGTTLKMRVVDAATGKPIAGAQFNSFRGGDFIKSGADGTLQARVISGDSMTPNLGGVRAPGYKYYSVPKLSAAQTGATADLGTIKLERGAVVKGRVRAQNEESPADWPTLSFQSGGTAEYINLKDDATFESSAMKPGIYNVYVYKSWGSVPSKDWEVVSPKTIAVPAPDVVAKPVEIVIRRLTPAKVGIKSARGRILDENGDPIAGALVSGQFTSGTNSSGAREITGADGRWNAQAAFDALEFKIADIERPGYLQSGQGKITVIGGVAVVSGLAMKRRGAPFSARVADADGAPASGAWIAVLEDRYFAPVRADENGRFELPDLALDKFTLLAARGNNWARVETGADAKNSEIRLAAPVAVERAAAVEAALQGDSELYFTEDYWDALGWERISELAGRANVRNEWEGYWFAQRLAEREPTIFLERAPAMLAKMGGEYRDEIEAKWREVQAQNGDADARIEASGWVDAQKAAKKAIDAASVTQLLRAAAVADKLGRADAADLSDYAAAIAAQLPGGASDSAEDWGEASGSSGYAATQRFTESMKPVAEFKVWQSAAPLFAESGDVAGTQAAIKRMETLAATPALVDLARRESWNDPNNQIEYIRVQAARSLSASDIGAAQALIENLPDDDYNKGRAARTIADRAIKNGDKAVAEKMLRGAMKTNISNAEGFALTASLAQRVSPELGAELWAEALKKALPARENGRFGSSFEPSVAMWAFYHAPLDAAQSRVLIEREWNWRLPKIAPLKDDEWNEEAANLERLAMAMGAIDPARALEMRAQFGQVAGKPARAGVGLAAALLSSDAERARFGVDGRY